MAGEKTRSEVRLALLTLGVSAAIKAVVALLALFRAGWNGEAPVKLKYFVAVTALEALAVGYVLLKVWWLGVPAVVG